MNELQAIGTVLSSLKTASEMAKAFIDVKAAVEVQGKVFELQRVILAAQQEAFTAQQTQFALTNRIGELEKQIADMEAWARESERYQLSELVPGVFAYKLKPGPESPEPEHELCANCFGNHRKSVLQKEMLDIGRTELRVCHACGAELTMHGGRQKPSTSSLKPRPNPFSRSRQP